MSSGTSLAIEDEEDDDTGSLSSMRGKPSVMLGGPVTGTDIKAPSVGEAKGDADDALSDDSPSGDDNADMSDKRSDGTKSDGNSFIYIQCIDVGRVCRTQCDCSACVAFLLVLAKLCSVS